MSYERGFKTEKGSIYAMSEDGKMLRYKPACEGRAAKLNRPSKCFFASPDEDKMITKHYLRGGFSRYIFEIGTEGEKPFYAIRDDRTDENVASGALSIMPELGFTPLEYEVKGKFKFVHVGNRIIEIYGNRPELEQAMPPELRVAVEVQESEENEKKKLWVEKTNASQVTQHKSGGSQLGT